MEQGYLVELICDTSFLIHLATRRIKNIDKIDIEIGPITFVIPQVVLNEISELIKNPQKSQEALATKNFIKNFKIISIIGNFADKELIDYVKKNRAIIGTMDKQLKKQVKEHGSSIISFSNDKMILEP